MANSDFKVEVEARRLCTRRVRCDQGLRKFEMVGLAGEGGLFLFLSVGEGGAGGFVRRQAKSCQTRGRGVSARERTTRTVFLGLAGTLHALKPLHRSQTLFYPLFLSRSYSFSPLSIFFSYSISVYPHPLL